MKKLVFSIFLIVSPLLKAQEALSVPTLNATKGLIYSLEDLSALEKKKSYEEFFLHAHDITPGKRDENWSKMVTSMAQAFALEINKKKNYTQNTFTIIENLYSWPELQADEFFTRDRNELGLKYLDKCFTQTENKKQKESCLEQALGFWRASVVNAELSFKMGNLIASYVQEQRSQPFHLSELISDIKVAQIKLLEFYSVALKSPLSEFYCKESQLKELLWNEFVAYANKVQPNQEQMKKYITQNIHSDCWRELRHDYFDYLASNDTFKRDFAYLFLAAQNELTQEQRDLYLFVYILQTPSIGDTFNQAWSNLEMLGKDYERRMRLLKAVKRLDPLPDQLFSTFGHKKALVVTKHLAAHFPEYLDFYSRTCLNYIQGKDSFPRGNPTINCKDFYELSSKEKIIDNEFLKQYQKSIQI